jgi:hypothetical protein
MSNAKIRWEEEAHGRHCGFLLGQEAFSYVIQEDKNLTYKLYDGSIYKSHFHSLGSAREYAEVLLGRPLLPDLFRQLETILTEIKLFTDVLDARDIKDVLIPMRERIEEQISQLQNIWNYAYELETDPGQYE